MGWDLTFMPVRKLQDFKDDENIKVYEDDGFQVIAYGDSRLVIAEQGCKRTDELFYGRINISGKPIPLCHYLYENYGIAFSEDQYPMDMEYYAERMLDRDNEDDYEVVLRKVFLDATIGFLNGYGYDITKAQKEYEELMPRFAQCFREGYLDRCEQINKLEDEISTYRDKIASLKGEIDKIDSIDLPPKKKDDSLPF